MVLQVVLFLILQLMWLDVFLLLSRSLERWSNVGRMWFFSRNQCLLEKGCSCWPWADSANLILQRSVRCDFPQDVFFLCWKRHNCTPENVLISYSILCCRGCAEDLYSLNQFLVRPTTAPGDVSWLEICCSRSGWGQDTSLTVKWFSCTLPATCSHIWIKVV